MTEQELQELIRLRNALSSVRPQGQVTEAPAVPGGLMGLGSPDDDSRLARPAVSQDIRLQRPGRQYGRGLTPQEWAQFEETFIGGEEKLPFAYPVESGETIRDAVGRVKQDWENRMSKEDFDRLQQLEDKHGVNPNILPQRGRTPQSVGFDASIPGMGQAYQGAPLRPDLSNTTEATEEENARFRRLVQQGERLSDTDPSAIDRINERSIEAGAIDIFGEPPEKQEEEPIEPEEEEVTDDGLEEDIAALPPAPEAPDSRSLFTRENIANALQDSFATSPEQESREREARMRMQERQLPTTMFRQTGTPNLDNLMQQARRIASRM